uniref:SET domain-containing protein n=1 Tax=Angiostrongylus cantonensis TaxID=6313 RepID=A0A0K0DIQ6_ANGCA
MRQPPSGHMVINMRTTITTHGAHNGMIVQADAQWYVPSRFPQIDTPGSTAVLRTIAPGVSQENLAASWPTLHVAANSPQPERQTSQQGSSPLPPQATFSPQHHLLPRERSPVPPRIPSPVFSFNGQDSPPDEFIQPTKVTLNVFNLGRPDPVRYETGLRRSNAENADALISDTVTTTTTVEVFRTPLDPANPERLVALPPPPVPSIDGAPQMLRVNGPAYEKWTTQRIETLINDRPIQTETHPGKAVQWKKTLVEEQGGAKKVTVYDPYSGSRSPYKNVITTPQPLSSHQIQLATVNSFDERLLPHHEANRSAYLVQSPTEFSQVSHPFIIGSQGNLSRSTYRETPVQPKALHSTNDFHDLVCHPAIPDTSLDYLNQHETPILSQSSNSGYEQVRRTVKTLPHSPKDSRSECRNFPSAHYFETHRTWFDKATTLPPERHRSKRSHSSYRRRRNNDDERRRNRHRSESPVDRRLCEVHSTPSKYNNTSAGFESVEYAARPDPNVLPGAGPLRAKSQEIFNLYQTRDAMQNVVAQLTQEVFYGGPIAVCPMKFGGLSVGYLRPLHRTTCATLPDDLYGELEHIYEELDNYQCRTVDSPEESISGSTLKEDDIIEESKYAIIDFKEKINETSDEVRNQDGEESDGNDVASRLRREVANSVPQTSVRIRKAHPNGLVFPKITSIVSTLPEVPEELEMLPQAPNGEGIILTYIPYADESSRVPDQELPHTDSVTTKDDSKVAVIRTSTELRADQHRLVIKGWETLISDSDEGS